MLTHESRFAFIFSYYLAACKGKTVQGKNPPTKPKEHNALHSAFPARLKAASAALLVWVPLTN